MLKIHLNQVLMTYVEVDVEQKINHLPLFKTKNYSELHGWPPKQRNHETNLKIFHIHFNFKENYYVCEFYSQAL